MILLPILLFLIVLLLQFRTILRNSQYFYIFIFSLFVKLFFLVLSEFGVIIPVDGGGDAIGFIRESFRLYESYDLIDILTKDLSGKFGTYPLFLNVIYKLIYPSHLVMLLINILLHNSIILLMARILEYLSLSKIKKKILMLLVAFFPIIISYSIILLREIIYIWFVTYLCYQFFYYNQNNRLPNSIFLTLAISTLVIILHPGNITLLVGSYFLFFKLNKIVKIVSIGLVFILGMSLFISGQFGGGYGNKFRSKDNTIILQAINLSRENSSAYYEKFYTNSFVNNVFYAFPIDFINFFYRPFVFPISNIYKRMLRYPYGLISLYLSFLLLKKFKYMNSFEKKFLWFLIIGILPFVIGSGDLFQAVRHRMNFFTLYVILIAILLQKNKLYNQKYVR